MEIVLFADNTLGVSLQRLAQLLSSESSGVRVSAAALRFRPVEDRLVYENERATLIKLAAQESSADILFFLTSRPFENNFFYTGDGSVFLCLCRGGST